MVHNNLPYSIATFDAIFSPQTFSVLNELQPLGPHIKGCLFNVWSLSIKANRGYRTSLSFGPLFMGVVGILVVGSPAKMFLGYQVYIKWLW